MIFNFIAWLMDMLEKLRKKIDQIDDELLKLFNERIVVVQEVGKLKRTTQAPIYRPES